MGKYFNSLFKWVTVGYAARLLKTEGEVCMSSSKIFWRKQQAIAPVWVTTLQQPSGEAPLQSELRMDAQSVDQCTRSGRCTAGIAGNWSWQQLYM